MRTCSQCTLCCVALRIDSLPGFTTTFHTGEDIGKAQGEPCRFLAKEGTGCTIYESRPAVCRNFLCDWIKGGRGYRDTDSPKSIGIVGVYGNPVGLMPLEKSDR
jgi:Fe-S-cluster containining protein